METQQRIGQFYAERPLMRDNDYPQRVVELMHGEVDEVGGELIGDVDTEKLGLEIADVVIYAMCLAEMFSIDLNHAVLKKIAINEERFPAHLFDYSSGDDFEGIYMARKRELGER